VDTGSVQNSRSLETSEPIDLGATLASLRRGSGDPVHRRTPDGAIWRAVRTPDGPATIRLTARPSERRIEASAWGPGAEWLLERLPAFVGAEDDLSGFEPGNSLLERLAKQFKGWRVPRTGLVWDALVPAILEQKVTGKEAWRSWRELVWRFGERAPGPVPFKLWVAPSPRTFQTLASWDYHLAGVGPERSQAIVRAARVADRLEETITMTTVEAERRLRTVPGIGVWTAAEVRQRAHGDADAVSVGDYHIAKNVGWALAGRRFDDDEMLEVLERWRGHRYRVTRLIELAGIGAPRRGPRYAGRNYRSM
jgi:3-methyladenine DNA glycosylase/8-oxoguanine DNA glycosylase